MELPSFLRVTPPQQPVQPVLPTPYRTPTPASNGAEVRERTLAQFEAVFPRLMERIYAGDTLQLAVRELPIAIDYGAFNRWVMKDARRKAIYEEAKEFRTEVWADRMIQHAETGTDANGDAVTLERSKFAFDTYKWLMGRHNKKAYGESKTLEVEHRISIRSALEQAEQRVIEATVVSDNYLPDDEDDIKALVSGDDEDEDSDDD